MPVLMRLSHKEKHMSLNFDFTQMVERLGKEEYDRITDHPTIEGKWHPVTDALIWMTMAVGMGEITEKNADKFADRLLAYQALNGACLRGPDGEVYITSEDVKNHIGLSTNVFPMETDAQFAKKLRRIAMELGYSCERKQEVSAHTLCQPKTEDA
jgi:hypothetical protein